jgi:hypothetical protein
VATRSIGLYLLLEGLAPTATLYPKRRGVNKRRCVHFSSRPAGIVPRGASSAYQNREVAVSRPARAYSQFLKTKKAANTTAKVASTRSKASSTNGMMCAIPFLAPSAERRLRDARRRNPVRNTRGMTLGGGWAPDQARGMDYERSRASSNAHRLRRPQVQRVYLTLSFSLAPTRTSWRSNALREALEGSSMAA